VTPPAIEVWEGDAVETRWQLAVQRGGEEAASAVGCWRAVGWAGGGGAASVERRQRRLRGDGGRPRGDGRQPEVEDEPRGGRRDGSRVGVTLEIVCA
jgi:hypothetical protein